MWAEVRGGVHAVSPLALLTFVVMLLYTSDVPDDVGWQGCTDRAILAACVSPFSCPSPCQHWLWRWRHVHVSAGLCFVWTRHRRHRASSLAGEPVAAASWTRGVVVVDRQPPVDARARRPHDTKRRRGCVRWGRRRAVRRGRCQVRPSITTSLTRPPMGLTPCLCVRCFCCAAASSLYGLDAGVPTLVQVELQHLVAPASEECVGRVELELLYWPAMGQRTSSLRGRPPSMSTGSDLSLESGRVPLSGSPQAAAVASAVGGNWPAGTSRTLARHLPPQLPLPVRHAAASSHGGVATMRHRANTYSAPRRGSPAASEHARRAQRAMAVSTRARASHARASSSRVSSMSPVHLDLSGGTSGGIASSDDEVVTAGNRVVHDELESIL